MKSNRIWPACLLAALVFGACSVDKPVSSNDSGVISFRATVPFATKASSVTTANIGEFHVTAIGNAQTFFEAEHVSVSGAGVCTMDKSYYWPAYELGFYAYANTSDGTASIANAAKGIAGVTPVAAAADQKDFVVAYKTGTKANDMASGVALNFRHALSQVVVKAKNLSTSGLKINVKGVKVANVKSSGDFTFPAAVTDPHDGGTLDFALWNSSSASKGAYTIGGASETAVVLDGTAKDIMFSGASWMLIPQQLVAWDLAIDKANANNNAFIGVYVQILDAADNQLYPATAGEYAYANVPVDTKWEPGKKYTYTLNFLDETVGGGAGVDDNGDPVLGQPISFTLTVDDWDDQYIQLAEDGSSRIIQLLTNKLGGYNVPIANNSSLPVDGGKEVDLSIPTFETLSLELNDVPQTVIPSSNFSLSTDTLTPSNDEFSIEMDDNKPSGLDSGVSYRGPDLIVKTQDDVVVAKFAVEGTYSKSFAEQYLTIEALQDNTSVCWRCSKAAAVKTIEYSTDMSTWTEASSVFNYLSGEICVLNTGDKVYLRGDNSAISTSTSNYCFFTFDKNVKVYGNIMSLLSSSDYVNADSVSSYGFTWLFRYCTTLVDASGLVFPANNLSEYCYYLMFEGCSSLIQGPQELPAMSLGNYCYDSMFIKCSSLISAPDISATVFTTGCCSAMFSECTNLVNVPDLHATTLAFDCCNAMFDRCISLKNAPALPATTLASGCYSNMFNTCTSLEQAPVLPAMSLISNCYLRMFYGCSSLNYVKAGFTTTPSNSYTQEWLSGVSPTGSFVKNASASWDVTGTNGVPSGWTVQVE